MISADDVREGMGVFFDCEVTSNPPPSRVIWLHKVSDVSAEVSGVSAEVSGVSALMGDVSAEVGDVSVVARDVSAEVSGVSVSR